MYSVALGPRYWVMDLLAEEVVADFFYRCEISELNPIIRSVPFFGRASCPSRFDILLLDKTRIHFNWGSQFRREIEANLLHFIAYGVFYPRSSITIFPVNFL